jgi:hypothetical protein
MDFVRGEKGQLQRQGNIDLNVLEDKNTDSFSHARF